MARTTGHPKEESFNFRVPATLKAAFQKAVAMEDRPAGQVIRDLMREYITEHQAPEPGHDAWFKMKVQEALDNPLPGKSHDDVMKEALLLIEKLSKKQNDN